MTIRSSTIFVIAALVAMLGGCASSGKQCPTDESPKSTGSGAFDAPAALRDASEWLPTDTSVVVVAEPGLAWQMLAEFLPRRTDSRDAGAQSNSTENSEGLPEPRGVDAIRAEMQRLSVARLGFDITAAEAIVVGGSPTWEATYLKGKFGKPRAEASTVSGQQVYRFEGLARSQYSALDTVWVVPTQEPQGMAIFARASSMRTALSGRETGGQTLAEGPGLGRLSELLGERPGTRLYAAALADVEPLASALEGRLSFEPPAEVVAGLGEFAWGSARGSKSSLDAIETRYGQVRERFDELREQKNRVVAEESLDEAMVTTAVFGVARSYFDHIESKRAEGRLTYAVPLPRTTSLSLVAAGALSYLMPQLLRDPTVRQTREASERMRKMADGARAYFESEQKYAPDEQKAREPWHRSGQGSQAPGYPVPWTEYVFPGGTDQKLVSHDKIPQGGRSVEPNPSAQQYLEATMHLLHVDFEEPTPFRFTYETNGMSGPGAEAVIRAEADFDPSTTEHHTMEVRLKIDPVTQEVIVMPMVTTNEYE